MVKYLIPAPIPAVNAWSSNQLLPRSHKTDLSSGNRQGEVAQAPCSALERLQSNDENQPDAAAGLHGQFSQPLHTQRQHHYNGWSNKSGTTGWNTYSQPLVNRSKQGMETSRGPRKVERADNDRSHYPTASAKSYSSNRQPPSVRSSPNRGTRRRMKHRGRPQPAFDNEVSDAWTALKTGIEDSSILSASVVLPGNGGSKNDVSLWGSQTLRPLSKPWDTVDIKQWYNTYKDHGMFQSHDPSMYATASVDESLGLDQLIKEQLHYYFSTENLCKDIYLRSLFDERSGAIPLDELIKFNRLRFMTNDGKNVDLLKQVIRDDCSDILELVDEESVRYNSWAAWKIDKNHLKIRSSAQQRELEST